MLDLPMPLKYSAFLLKMCFLPLLMIDLALNFAKKAIKNIDKDTVEWYRANDLIQLIIGIDEKDNKNKTNIKE